jgi:hypothetical protein
MSRLAIVAFVLSVVCSPPVLRFTPRPIVIAAWKATHTGAFLFVIPVVGSLIFTMSVRAYMRCHTHLGGKPWVVIALIINLLSFILYLGIGFIFATWRIN